MITKTARQGKIQNRKFLLIAPEYVTILALLLFVISKAEACTHSDLLLWGVVLAAAVKFLAALKDIRVARGE